MTDWQIEPHTLEFWRTLSKHTYGLGLAQPTNRDISLDGQFVECYRDNIYCFTWISSRAIRRVNLDIIGRVVAQEAGYCLNRFESERSLPI